MEFFQVIVSLFAAVVRSGYATCKKLFGNSNEYLAPIIPPSPYPVAESSPPKTSTQDEMDFDVSRCEDFLFRIPESIKSKRFPRIVDDCLRHYPSKWIVDVSWETCNPTSASVYNIVKEKAGYYATKDHQYVIVGPYNPCAAEPFIEHDLPSNSPLAITVAIMRKAGMRVAVGRWLVPGSPLTILFDIMGAQGILGQCRYMIENKYSVKISPDDNLASGAIIFGHMVEAFLGILNEVLHKQAAAQNLVSPPIIAHFHEWTSALGILFMKMSNLIKGVAIGYTEHESPSMSFTRTGCSTGWMTHRDLFNNWAKYEADMNIQYGDQLDFVYDEAITICQNEQFTLYFDMIWNFDLETQMAIQDCASSHTYNDRYAVLAPCFEETNLRGVIDEVEVSGGSPLAFAVQALRRDGYRVTVGRLKIPGQPLIVLFHLLDARNIIFRRSLWNLPPMSFCNDESVYHHLASLFFSNFNSAMIQQEIRTGQKLPKSVRIYQ